jgi:hypothetical protein
VLGNAFRAEEAAREAIRVDDARVAEMAAAAQQTVVESLTPQELADRLDVISGARPAMPSIATPIAPTPTPNRDVSSFAPSQQETDNATEALWVPSQQDTDQAVKSIETGRMEEPGKILQQLAVAVIKTVKEIDDLYNVGRYLTSLTIIVKNPGSFELQIADKDCSEDPQALANRVAAELDATGDSGYHKPLRDIDIDLDSEPVDCNKGIADGTG